MKRRLLLLLPLLFAGALAFLFLWMEASSQGWGGTYYEFECLPPPTNLPSQAGCLGEWSQVKLVMHDSGCPGGAGVQPFLDSTAGSFPFPMRRR